MMTSPVTQVYCDNFIQRVAFGTKTKIKLRAVFISVSKNNLVLAQPRYAMGLKNSRHLFLQSGVKKLAPPFHPIRSKTNINRDSNTFPTLIRSFSGAWCQLHVTTSRFWLVHWIACAVCDWLGWLLWFWFYVLLWFWPWFKSHPIY